MHWRAGERRGEAGGPLRQSTVRDAYSAGFAALFGNDCQAFPFWKGRVALYAILESLGIGAGDEVILPGYTCVVVANSIRQTGAVPVYADIAPGTYNIDPRSVESRLSERTRAVIAQHTYGIPADLDSLQAIATARGLALIEDCAHVLPGSKFAGRPLGFFGRAAFFSSQWSKPYTTGLGGIALTADRELAARLSSIHAQFSPPAPVRILQLQMQYAAYRALFRSRLYWASRQSLHLLSKVGLFVGSSDTAELIGGTPVDARWRMGNFQQRVGVRRLRNLAGFAAHRRRLTRYYAEGLGIQEGQLYGGQPPDEITLLRFPVQVENKASLLASAASTGIEIGSWFETPLHPLPMEDHPRMQYRPGSCPVAETTARRVINLPLHERVTGSDAARIRRFVSGVDGGAGVRKEAYVELR